MTDTELLDMVRKYQGLLDTKEQLATLTKQNNAAIEAAKAEIAQQMVDDDCPRITWGGYNFSLTSKTIYSKRSEAELAESDCDFLETLRDEGFEHLIVESVNPRTLQSAMRAYVDEHGELSDALCMVIKGYDTFDITRRKESGRFGGKRG